VSLRTLSFSIKLYRTAITFDVNSIYTYIYTMMQCLAGLKCVYFVWNWKLWKSSLKFIVRRHANVDRCNCAVLMKRQITFTEFFSVTSIRRHNKFISSFCVFCIKVSLARLLLYYFLHYLPSSVHSKGIFFQQPFSTVQDSTPLNSIKLHRSLASPFFRF
jgi:hypothetical protein